MLGTFVKFVFRGTGNIQIVRFLLSFASVGSKMTGMTTKIPVRRFK